MKNRLVMKCIIIFSISIITACFSNPKTIYQEKMEKKYDQYKAKNEVKLMTNSILDKLVVNIDTIFYPNSLAIQVISDFDQDNYGYAFIPKKNIIDVLNTIFSDYKIEYIYYYNEIGKITKAKLDKMFLSISYFQIIVILKKGTDESYLVFNNINDKWYLNEFYYSDYDSVKEACNCTSTTDS